MRLTFAPLAFAAGVLVTLCAVDTAARHADLSADCGWCSEFLGPEPPAEAVVPEARPIPVPTPLNLSALELADEETYMDVFRVLKEENSCSRFFGGPAKAVEVFNHFSRTLKRKRLRERDVAVRMSGNYTRYHNIRTGASYRIFDEATLNSGGPFAGRVPPPGGVQAMIGRFQLQTRQARALIFLHELGHLMEGSDGKWLLPNDGGDADLSDRNTRIVEGQCTAQLIALKD